MDEPQSLDAEFLERVLIEALKLGAIPEAAVEQARTHFDHQARQKAGSSAAERYEALSDKASAVLLQASAPSLGEFRAAHNRQQMRLRSERDAGPPDPP